MMKISKLVVIIGMGMLVLVGCSDKKIDMTPSQTTDNTDVTVSPVVSKTPGASEGDGENEIVINDKISMKTADGRGFTCNINLDYKYEPGEDDSRVIAFKAFRFDEAHKEKIVKGLFGDSEVYSGDKEELSVEQLQALIRQKEEELENISHYTTEENYYEYQKDEINSEIAHYRELINSASSTSHVIDNYDHSIFLGHIPGVSDEYAVYFAEPNGLYVELYIGLAKTLPYRATVPMTAINYDRCTAEQMSKTYNEMLSKIGLAPMEVIEKGFEERVDKMFITDRMFTASGYSYVYMLDGKIAYTSIINPIEEIEVYDNVERISLSEVKSIFLDVCRNNPNDYFGYNNSGYIDINTVEFKHTAFEKDGRTYLMPAWVFNDSLAINAVDGTCVKKTNRGDGYVWGQE